MKLAGLHPDEQRRLQSLRSSGLLNSGKEERFDRLTRLARSLYNLPVASISLVGKISCISSPVPVSMWTRCREIFHFAPIPFCKPTRLSSTTCSRTSAFTITRWLLRRRLSALRRVSGATAGWRDRRVVLSDGSPAAIVFRP